MTFEEYNYAIEDLNKATVAYDKGQPIMTDKEWDDLYFAVSEYEYWNGALPESPTQKIHFETVSELKKVKHNHPMLSLNKTKDINEVEAFIGNHDYVIMPKMDGLTCSLYYENGKLVSAETRGNGIEGEDITHNAMVIPSIPKRINFKESITIDGEIICTYDDFEEWSNVYKNPRNFAAGSIRLLDSKECKERNLKFIAWDAIDLKRDTLHEKLEFMIDLGFLTVNTGFTEFGKLYLDRIEESINQTKTFAQYYGYPIDGVVFKYDNCKEYEAAGRTEHHFKGGLAYKFYDEEYETKLKNIVYNTSRNGILTPVAIVEPIEIDGTTIERCSLSNLSILEEKLGKPYIGQKVWITKRNQIIPYIERAEKIDQ